MPSVPSLFALAGRVALVTGGSRGIGLDIALALGEAGASVAVTARREEFLQDAEARLRARGISCAAMRGDVADPASVADVIDQTLDRFGRIDVLVNNAGVTWAAPAAEMPVEKWRQVLDVNATGCFLMSQAAGRQMIRQGGGGSIVNIASIAGLGGTSPEVLDAVGYSASKAAVIGLTRDLAVKWALEGIRVNAIAPGFVETRMTTALLARRGERIVRDVPMGRIGRPDEIAAAVLFFASPASSYITGQVLAVDGGATAQL